jgi:predicted amidophosphoribosyltransferase
MAKQGKSRKDEYGEPMDSCGAIYKNNKFYCADCGAELTQNRDCPACGRQVAWDRAIINMRRGSLPQ